MSKGKSDVTTVVRFSGARCESIRCTETPQGTLKSLDGRYEFAADVCELVGPLLYAVAVDEVTLRSETDFHATRRRIIFRAMFENNSDIMKLLHDVTIGVTLVVAVLLWFQFGALSGQIGHMSAILDAIQKAGGK